MVSRVPANIIRPKFYRILSKFPQNLSFCFGYGSAVKKQTGYDGVLGSDSTQSNVKLQPKKPTMIDLLFTVENSYQWHAQNLTSNPDHYSSIRLLGSKAIASYQESYGAKVFCNTLIPVEGEQGVMIKYGVISTKDLIVDLLDWRDLYVAGRLQKPVEIIKEPSNSKIQNALEINLESAVRAALILLPSEFSDFEFFCAISNLSYNGDFRMIFGENKNKVQNIVEPQMESFRSLYAPSISLFKAMFEFGRKCRQDKSPQVVLQHLNQLPKFPVRRIVREWNRGKYRMDTEDVLRAVACSPQCQDIVRKSLADIVWQSSAKQSIKNIPTAGLRKSFDYSLDKAAKTFNL